MVFRVARNQLGVVLITAMVLLAVLTLLGMTAMKVANMEELMTGNLRDRNFALQAAEMGLRYAEQHISDNDPETNIPNSIDGVTGFDATCTGGYCYYGQNKLPPAIAAIATYCTPGCPLVYVPGTVFMAGAINYTAPVLPAGVPAPTYLIEGMKKALPGSSGYSYFYRVSVRAQGVRPGTVVWLQEIFKP